MEELGREDGAAVADWIIAELGLARAPSEFKDVGKSAVDRIKELVRSYEERGVSESLIAVWRSACVAEIYRRFAELRQASPEATESGPAKD